LAESEAAVLFTTYQWGKPQLPCSKGAGENAEGASLPAIASRSGEAGGTPPLIRVEKTRPEALEQKKKPHGCPTPLWGMSNAENNMLASTNAMVASGGSSLYTYLVMY